MKLHVGCGKKHFDGYVNIDCIKYKEADMAMMLPNGLEQFSSSSIEEITSNHFVEHLLLKDCQKFLKESYRILESGGKLIIRIPCLFCLCRDYVRAVEENHQKHIYSITWCLCGETDSIPESHKWHYTHETLSQLLRGYGFKILEAKHDNESNWIGDYIPCNVFVKGEKP